MSMLAVFAAAGLVASAQDRPTFRAGVELVSLSVTATDAGGGYVTGLTADDFVVLEDGLPQDVVFFSPAEAHLSVSLLIDSSGSMQHRLGLARHAASNFVTQLRDGDLVQVIDFSSRVQVLQPFTDDRTALERALGTISAGGLTSLYNAVYIALRSFDGRSTTPDPNEIRRHVIVVLSDGEDTSSMVTYDAVLDEAKRSQSVIYPIALALDPAAAQQDPERMRLFVESPRFILRQLARETGGRLLLAEGPGDLDAVYEAIADELAHQYVLGYQPRPAEGGRDEWRSIGVLVNQPNVQARTRPGYFADAGLRVASR